MHCEVATTTVGVQAGARAQSAAAACRKRAPEVIHACMQFRVVYI
jgi:hypothetical protein